MTRTSRGSEPRRQVDCLPRLGGPGPAPASSINYYTKVAETLGGPQEEWIRLFLMPGMGHCRGGPGPNDADFVAALERWRESGVAPDAIQASHRTDGRVNASAPTVSSSPGGAVQGAGNSDDSGAPESERRDCRWCGRGSASSPAFGRRASNRSFRSRSSGLTADDSRRRRTWATVSSCRVVGCRTSTSSRVAGPKPSTQSHALRR